MTAKSLTTTPEKVGNAGLPPWNSRLPRAPRGGWQDSAGGNDNRMILCLSAPTNVAGRADARD
jgi:hypothetical protein